jgi:hypothetical protein
MFEYHWLEAEQADSIIKPLEVASDENASEGKFIHSPSGTGHQYALSHIMALYTVNISQEGEYILWGRVKILNQKHNSFFVQINDDWDNLWEIELGNHWHWDMVNDRNKSIDPMTFTLSKGVHTIKIKLREDGTKLDKMLLTNNMGFVPSGRGDVAEKSRYSEDH